MEQFDICDEHGRPTGETVARADAHRDGTLHRTAHVWIARQRDGGFEILLQKRSQDKDSFPGLYDTSSAGHIPAGQEPLPSALRELQEELGICAGPKELTFIGSFRIQYVKDFHGKPFHDNEITWVYLLARDVDESSCTLQESEVDEVRWFPLEEVYGEIRHRHDRFCVPPQGLQLLRDYLLTRTVRDACHVL
ncbi:MAG: NUDIX domain-containing protein [Clostridia bacterium]|nr:NUDIX domain-containing protein [Clostridia bacterium]